jgi:hypothetical protein
MMEKLEPNTMDREKETEIPESNQEESESPDSTSAIEDTSNRNEPLAGLKLYFTLGTIVIAGFLIALDASIIVTVWLLLHHFVLVCRS